jgi:hypothetical protein
LLYVASVAAFVNMLYSADFFLLIFGGSAIWVNVLAMGAGGHCRISGRFLLPLPPPSRPAEEKLINRSFVLFDYERKQKYVRLHGGRGRRRARQQNRRRREG